MQIHKITSLPTQKSHKLGNKTRAIVAGAFLTLGTLCLTGCSKDNFSKTQVGEESSANSRFINLEEVKFDNKNNLINFNYGKYAIKSIIEKESDSVYEGQLLIKDKLTNEENDYNVKFSKGKDKWNYELKNKNTQDESIGNFKISPIIGKYYTLQIFDKDNKIIFNIPVKGTKNNKENDISILTIFGLAFGALVISAVSAKK